MMAPRVSISMNDSLMIKGGRDNMTFHRPTSLSSLLLIKRDIPGARIVVGNTEVGIEVKFRNIKSPHVLSTERVPEMNSLTWNSNSNDILNVGASVSLSTLQHSCVDRSKKQHG